jgi:hypothetical protein
MESALRELRATHAANPAGANARLSAAESRATADMHATTHASAANMHRAAAHAASSAAMRMLGQGRGGNR